VKTLLAEMAEKSDGQPAQQYIEATKKAVPGTGYSLPL
jgi:hypothetical protein